MDLTQRALILRRHGHPHEEIAALLGVEVAAVAAAEKDPSGSPLVADSGGGVTEALLGDTGFEYQGNWGDGGGDGVRLFKIGNIAFAVGYAYYTGAYSDSIVCLLPAGWHSVDGAESVGTANSEDFIQCGVSSAALVTHKLAATMPNDGYVFFQASWAVS